MTDTPTPSVPFRTATQPSSPVEAPTPSSAAPKEVQQRISTSDDDAPPSLYNELEKKPYAVKFLDLSLYHDDPDFADVRQQAKALDDYVLKQIKARGLKDEKASYEEVVNAIYKQIGRSKNEDPVKSLRRLSVAAGAIDRLEAAKLPPVLSARSLDPTEFEEVQP